MRFVTARNLPDKTTRRKLPKKVVHDGRIFYTVNDAARMLGTSVTKVRELMGSGKLEWTQFKVNGKLFVSGDSLVKFKNEWPSKSATDA